MGHRGVRQNIMALVERFPFVAEDYSQLQYYYWKIFDGCESLEDIVNATPAESINRNFRKLVEVGAVVVPQRVLNTRKLQEVNYRHEFSGIQ